MSDAAADVLPARPLAPTVGPLTWRDALISLAIFSLVLRIFVHSPMIYMGDSKYTLLLTHSLLTRGSFLLDGYGIPQRPPLRQGEVTVNGDLYQIEIVDGHFYDYLPPGTAILCAPLLLVSDALGNPIFDHAGHYDELREASVQRYMASWLMAGLAVIFYGTARWLLRPAWSVGLALGGMLCTQAWSTASRALWTHTWGITLSGVVLFLLLGRATGRRRLSPVLLATLLSWMYFVRPTNSLFIVGCTVYVLVYHREMFGRYAVTGAAWFGAFVAWSWFHFGHLLPSYYQSNRLETAGFWEGLAGNLVSPSRGLLVYVPVTWFVVYLVGRGWRWQRVPGLVWLAAGVSVAHLAVIACFPYWYGGASYGPRFTTELVPLLFLLAVLGVRSALDERAEVSRSRGVWPWRITLATGGALALASAAIQYRGATQNAAARWNVLPASLEAEPTRLWDWRYPQFLAGIVDQPPHVFPDLPSRVEFGHDGASPYEYDGWSRGDPDVSWTNGARAKFVFATQDPAARSLRLAFRPYVHPPKLPRQRVVIALNGQRVADLVLDRPEERAYTFDLPPGALRPTNILTFDLPDARAPMSVEGQGDRHRLGIALRTLELR